MGALCMKPAASSVANRLATMGVKPDSQTGTATAYEAPFLRRACISFAYSGVDTLRDDETARSNGINAEERILYIGYCLSLKAP